MIVMRFLADGKIRWCFFPPNTSTDRTSKGIWLGGSEEPPEESDGATSAIEDVLSEGTDDESDWEVTTNKIKSVRFEGEDESVEEADEDDEEEEEESEEEAGGGGAGGFFAALQMEDQSDDDGDESDESSDETNDVDDK